LNAALATGQATPAVIEAYQAMATQFQATTRHSDDAIMSAQAADHDRQGRSQQMQLALTAVTNPPPA
jgi:hypothetical protein